MKQTYSFILASLTMALVINLSGCVGYQLGTMLPPDIKTVAIPTFDNQTDEPLLEVDVTRAVIEAIQRDGSLRVTDEGNADSILHVTLTDYKLVPVSYSETERTGTEEYRILITAAVLLQRTETGETIVSATGVQGEYTFDVVGDLTTQKRENTPEAAEDLAHDIVETVVESWQ